MGFQYACGKCMKVADNDINSNIDSQKNGLETNAPDSTSVTWLDTLYFGTL